MTGAPTVRLLERLRHNLNVSSVEAGLGVVPLRHHPGHLTARMPLTGRSRAADGQLSPSAIGMMVDLGIGVAIDSSSADSDGGPTVELSLALARQPAPTATFLVVEAEVVTADAVSGTASATIRDDTGVEVARALGVMAMGERPTDHPGRLPVEGGFAASHVRFEQIADDRGRAPVVPSMRNNRGSVHGGVLTGITLSAQQAFLGAGGGRGLTTTVHFLRPVPADVEHVEWYAEFLRHGRRFRTVRTRLIRPDGKVAVESTALNVLASDVGQNKSKVGGQQ